MIGLVFGLFGAIVLLVICVSIFGVMLEYPASFLYLGGAILVFFIWAGNQSKAANATYQAKRNQCITETNAVYARYPQTQENYRIYQTYINRC